MANNETPPNFRVVDLSAEIKKIWGPKFNAPEIAYEWSSGREHDLRTEDASIYITSPDF